MENAKEMLLKNGRLPVKVTPKAKQERLDSLNATGELVIKVRAVPEDGKANEAVITLLSPEWDIPKSRLRIARGEASCHKVIAYR